MQPSDEQLSLMSRYEANRALPISLPQFNLCIALAFILFYRRFLPIHKQFFPDREREFAVSVFGFAAVWTGLNVVLWLALNRW